MTPFLNNPTEPTEASRILIVEDEAIVAESLKDQLINLGYQVCGTAANGEDVMRIMEELIGEHSPDAVALLVDVRSETAPADGGGSGGGSQPGSGGDPCCGIRGTRGRGCSR